jgi:hypothetical protein
MRKDVTPEMITAYALGELSGEDAEAVKAFLLLHPELDPTRSIQALGKDLSAQLKKEPLPKGEGAGPVLQAVNRKPYIFSFFREAPSPAALALCLTVVFAVVARKRIVGTVEQFLDRENMVELEEDSAKSGLSVKDFLSALEARAFVPAKIKSCDFQIPKDWSSEEKSRSPVGDVFARVYQVAGFPMELTIQLSAAAATLAAKAVPATADNSATAFARTGKNTCVANVTLTQKDEEAVRFEPWLPDLQRVADKLVEKVQRKITRPGKKGFGDHLP